MPEMSAPGIADNLVADLERRRHQVVICNFANADMVGHTGSMEATIAAVETLDGCLGRIMTALRAVGGTAIVTSDHGNAEQMWDDELKAPHTAHTSNPVPVILCGDASRRSPPRGRLAARRGADDPGFAGHSARTRNDGTVVDREVVGSQETGDRRQKAEAGSWQKKPGG